MAAQAPLVLSVFSADSMARSAQPTHTRPIEFPASQCNDADSNRDETEDGHEHLCPTAHAAASHASILMTWHHLALAISVDEEFFIRRSPMTPSLLSARRFSLHSETRPAERGL